jgi:glycosyltransferase involved in cell wall biosynthesis
MSSLAPTSPIPVAVIIPCYRSAKTIERALDSVLQQSLAPAQIILIDDASNDGSLDVLDNLKKNHPLVNIQIESMSQNGGPGEARNRGWILASQPWLAFLDADDAWHTDKLRIQWEWILKNPDAQLIGHLHHEYHGVMAKTLLSQAVAARPISFWQMLLANRFYTRTVMLRRDLPFRFQNRNYTEDYLLWLEIILAGYPAYVINQDLAMSFRPEFSVGGYSGQLWPHEKRELRAWIFLYQAKKISLFTLAIALPWSYLKYLRRVLRGAKA